MTHEELTKALNGLATGETADTVANIGKEIDALYTTIETANKLHDDDAKKIEQLNDTNMKLFLRVTGGKPEEEQPPEKEETIDDFVKSLIAEDKKEGEK